MVNTGPRLVPTFTPTSTPEMNSGSQPQATVVPAAEPPESETVLVIVGGVEEKPEPLPDALGTGTIIRAEAINVHSGPGDHHDVIGVLFRDDEVTVLDWGENGPWAFVCCPRDDETPGWIHGYFMESEAYAISSERQRREQEHRRLTTSEVWIQTDWEASNNAPVTSVFEETWAGRCVEADCHSLSAHDQFLFAKRIVEDRTPQVQSVRQYPGSNVNPLTGETVSPERMNRRPMIVCLPRDHPHLKGMYMPMYGMSQADVVYAYPGDDIWFVINAIFFGRDVPVIGPVQLPRLSNLYLGTLYDGATVCAGGHGLFGQLLGNGVGGPFLAVNATESVPYVDVSAEKPGHFYTSTEAVHEWLLATNQQRPISLSGFEFGPPPPGGVEATYIVGKSGRGWGDLEFLPGIGRYMSHVLGDFLVDAGTGEPFLPANVIFQQVRSEQTYVLDTRDHPLSEYNVYGSGQAVVFRNGLGYTGTWASPERGQLPRFYTAAGHLLPLARGPTLIFLYPDVLELLE